MKLQTLEEAKFEFQELKEIINTIGITAKLLGYNVCQVDSNLSIKNSKGITTFNILNYIRPMNKVKVRIFHSPSNIDIQLLDESKEEKLQHLKEVLVLFGGELHELRATKVKK